MKSRKIEWKQTLVKSLIYRALTLVLGTLTAYIITGSIAIATGTALLTEAVQSVNYFAYEITWSNISRRKLEKKIIEQIKQKEIDLRLDLSSIKDLAYQLSQVNTFIPEIYISTKKTLDQMLETKELKEVHDEIEKYKEYFEIAHLGRNFNESKDQE
ncbi:MAG: DUF2061 domain-containing protein [Candidatus Lokiarchaeota archaeon]|nr:DUF2061 domain-containing protein [Candidatus Lokiarchaeota archaeon]